MARPWSRKRVDDPRRPKHLRAEDDPVDSVSLDAADHAWWSQTDVARAWEPPLAGTGTETATVRDVLAEHFGDDWRTSLGFDSSATEARLDERAMDEHVTQGQDAYRVLEVAPSATWEEIVAAHRHQARAHHPDRLFGQSEEEKAEGDERIRVINAAYQELRVRRGR